MTNLKRETFCDQVLRLREDARENENMFFLLFSLLYVEARELPIGAAPSFVSHRMVRATTFRATCFRPAELLRR